MSTPRLPNLPPLLLTPSSVSGSLNSVTEFPVVGLPRKILHSTSFSEGRLEGEFRDARVCREVTEMYRWSYLGFRRARTECFRKRETSGTTEESDGGERGK